MCCIWKDCKMNLLEMHGITKCFSGIAANDNIDLTVSSGEIHALLGENGAGKTTLMNILYGLYSADAGEIFFDGKKAAIHKPGDAISLGIGMVHQHFMLVSKMTALENITLGLKDNGYPVFDKEKIKGKIETIAEKYGLTVQLDRKIEDLSVGEQQRVEILKTLYRNARLLILDEPTSVLTPQETGELFEILGRLKAEGNAIILIAHNLSEILEISDNITVMRDGKKICTVQTKKTNAPELSRYMVGRSMNLDEPFSKNGQETDRTPVLEIKDVFVEDGSKIPKLQECTLGVCKNEILGIAGVDGNGQKELAECIMGLQKTKKGRIIFKGTVLGNKKIRKRIEMGIAYIPADRQRDGLIMDADIGENDHLKDYYLPENRACGILNKKKMQSATDRHLKQFGVKAAGIGQKARLLSGGNQQKLILAREIEGRAELIIACQPTRGLDIGATRYLREQLINCRNAGTAILLISTDLSEIMALSDRIAVLHGGRVMGVVNNDDRITAEEIGLMMGGEKRGIA